MAVELRSLAGAFAAHFFLGPRQLLTPATSNALVLGGRVSVAFLARAAGVFFFALYYRGSAYIFSAMGAADTSPLSTKPTTALVTTGPYAVSRNPAMLLIWCFHLACALTLNSLWLLLVACPATYIWLIIVAVPAEEAELTVRPSAAARPTTPLGPPLLLGGL